MTPKQITIQALEQLPDDADFADIINTVRFVAALYQGRQDLLQGKVLSNEEMKRLLDLELSK